MYLPINTYIDKLFVIIVPNIVLSLFKITTIVLIKIEIKIEYNKIKSTRNYFELCVTVQTSDKK